MDAQFGSLDDSQYEQQSEPSPNIGRGIVQDLGHAGESYDDPRYYDNEDQMISGSQIDDMHAPPIQNIVSPKNTTKKIDFKNLGL